MEAHHLGVQGMDQTYLGAPAVLPAPQQPLVRHHFYRQLTGQRYEKVGAERFADRQELHHLPLRRPRAHRSGQRVARPAAAPPPTELPPDHRIRMPAAGRSPAASV
jgi:hypothetical protein